MRILALDPASRCGWASITPDGLKSGCIAPKHKDEGNFCHEWRRVLKETIASEQPEIVFKEEQVTAISPGKDGTRARSLQSDGRTHWIHRTILEVCAEIHMNVRVVDVNNRTWRKRMYGTAAYPKGLNSAQRTSHWKEKAKWWCRINGLAVRNHDEAEAVVIAHFAHREMRIERATLQFDFTRQQPEPLPFPVIPRAAS